MTTPEKQPTDHTPRSNKAFNRYVSARLRDAMAGGFLTFITATLASGESTRRWLVLGGYLEAGGWFMDANWDFRLWSIWICGMLLGACIPRVQFPDNSGRVLFYGLLGVPIGAFCLKLMDAQMAMNAIERACAPFEGFKFPPMLTPESEVSYYRPPSHFEDYLVMAMILGLGVGALLGWVVNSTQQPQERFRFSLTLLALVIAVTFQWWLLRIRFDSYSAELQARIREHLAPEDRARIP